MSLNISQVNGTEQVHSASKVKKSNIVAFKADNTEATDEFVPEKKELSTEEKQKLIKSARNKASGWSIFGGPFSTLYYACRSNKTIAKNTIWMKKKTKT